MRGFKISEADAGKRADIFVTSKYPRFTRSSLGLLFDRHLVDINGQVAKPSTKIHVGDKLTIDDECLKANASPPDVTILYEDNDVIVMDKPAGVLTHSKGALNLEGTVASFIKAKIDMKELSGNRAGIVHRLDRATSGVIIAAKNAAALAKLQKQFSHRKVKKEYLAVVEGRPTPEAAIIDAPIIRNPANPQTFKVDSKGRPALTEYETLRHFSREGKDYSILSLKPTTGRTHQLRVHMAYIKHPIVGDPVYGNGGQSMLLHASRLEITLPEGTRRGFIAPMPKRIKEFTGV